MLCGASGRRAPDATLSVAWGQRMAAFPGWRDKEPRKDRLLPKCWTEPKRARGHLEQPFSSTFNSQARKTAHAALPRPALYYLPGPSANSHNPRDQANLACLPPLTRGSLPAQAADPSLRAWRVLHLFLPCYPTPAPLPQPARAPSLTHRAKPICPRVTAHMSATSFLQAEGLRFSRWCLKQWASRNPCQSR